jgi:hypothetical protein
MILYTGIGATKDVHTEKEFLDIMKKKIIEKDWRNVSRIKYIIQTSFKDWKLPSDFVKFTLADWIEYSGAEICE